MTAGKDAFKGLAVPLFGDFEIKQKTAATDIVTLTGASGQTGDFIVAQIDGGTEVFSVEDSGRVVTADWPVFNGAVATTKPTTAPLRAEGEIFFFWTTSVLQFGIGNATSTPWYATMTNNA